MSTPQNKKFCIQCGIHCSTLFLCEQCKRELCPPCYGLPPELPLVEHPDDLMIPPQHCQVCSYIFPCALSVDKMKLSKLLTAVKEEESTTSYDGSSSESEIVTDSSSIEKYRHDYRTVMEHPNQATGQTSMTAIILYLILVMICLTLLVHIAAISARYYCNHFLTFSQKMNVASDSFHYFAGVVQSLGGTVTNSKISQDCYCYCNVIKHN